MKEYPIPIFFPYLLRNARPNRMVNRAAGHRYGSGRCSVLVVLGSKSVLPLFGILGTMEDRVDDATIVILLEFEEDSERESADKSPAIGLVNAGIEEWSPLNRKKSCLDTAQKLHAETLGLIFVPKVGVSNIRLGLWEKEGWLSHFRIRIDCLTCSQLSPESGFWL